MGRSKLPSLLAPFAPGPEKPRLRDESEVRRLYRRYRLTVMLTLTLGYGFFYTCRLGLAVVKKPLIDNGIFTAEQLGWIGAGFLWGYGIGKLFNGFISDRVNIRAFLPAGLAISALINLAMGSNTMVGLAVTLWALNGWFQGFGAPASVVGITQWFGPRQRGTMYGLWSTAHSIGEGLTYFGTATLVMFTVWNAAFWGPGLVCLAVAVAMYLGLRDRPQTMGLPSVLEYEGLEVEETEEETTEAKRQARASAGRAQLALLKTPAIWVVGISSALMYVTRYAVNNWGVLYLQETHDFSLVEASGLIGINTIAGIFGSMAYGFISDRYFDARRPPVTLIFGLLEIVGLLIIFFGPPGPDLSFEIGERTLRFPVFLAAGFVLYGFTLSGILAVLGGLFAVDIADKRAAGAAMGVVGVFSYLGAGIQELVSGFLIERGTTMVDGVRQYDFTVPVAFWVGASMLSAVLAATLWRVRAKD